MSERTLSMMQYEDWRTLRYPYRTTELKGATLTSQMLQTNWLGLQNAQQPAYTSEQLRPMTDSGHDLWAALIGDSEARHALITQKLSGIGNGLNDLRNPRGAGEL
jgi:hypothetical protein